MALSVHYSGMRPRWQRLSILFIAAMQIFASPALTVADGYLAAAAPDDRAYAHIEEHGSSKCPRVHDEDNCAICHFLSRATAVKSDTREFPRIVGRIAAFLPAEFRAPSLASAPAQSLPRAPPIA
jgi:hypothetical protein